MSIKDEYLIAYPECQYTEALGRYVDFGQHVHETNCVDHIWNRRGNSEVWSNYATACPAAHDWKHRNSVVSRIGITWFKWDMARRLKENHETEMRHFDLDELRAASGFWIPGWVENKFNTVDLPGWCCQMALALIEGC